MVASLWANPNYDDTKDNKGTRKNAIESIEGDFKETLQAVDDAFSNRVVEAEEKLSKDNPFFAAAERGLEKVEQKAESVKSRNSHKEEDVDYMKGLDQE